MHHHLHHPLSPPLIPPPLIPLPLTPLPLLPLPLIPLSLSSPSHSLSPPPRQVPKAEKVLYGYDDVLHAADIIIVEGEMDKLSLEEAGYLNVVSVPDGAPAKVKVGGVFWGGGVRGWGACVCDG